jgi:uncharacterized membrane protein
MSRRIHLIDELRGLAIVLMIAFHFLYQLTLWEVLPVSILSHPAALVCQLGAQLLFISLAGLSCSFSNSNFKRSLISLSCAGIISLVTWLVMPEEMVIFGILHFMGVCILFFALTRKLWDKMSSWFGIFFFGALFVLSYKIVYSDLLLPSIQNIALTSYLWEEGYLTLLGFPSPTFYSSDFFPMIPWLFLFLVGVFIGQVVDKRTPLISFSQREPMFLAALGKRSLLIYMLHIPIIIGLIWIYNWILSLF